MKDDKVYLLQICDAIEKIRLFTMDIDKHIFMLDAKTQSSVLMQLILIGEISKKISEKTKKEIQLPWKDVMGFRDRAIHDYFQIDLDIVWATIQTDLLIVRNSLESFL